MNLDELYVAANEMCRKHWGIEFTGKITLTNRRWTRTQGRFRWWKKEPGRCQIEMSAKTNAGLSREAVMDTLLHELVHWRLYTAGSPYSDQDPEFIAECLRVGASLSGARYAQNAYQRYLREKEAIGQ